MALIKTDHSSLESAASKIDSFCKSLSSNIKTADQDVKGMLGTDWIGPDAESFRRKWELVDSKDRPCMIFKKDLEQTSEALKSAAKAYRAAQARAYNTAAFLPKWIV